MSYLTMSPSSKPCRTSSRQATTPFSSLLMLATMADLAWGKKKFNIYILMKALRQWFFIYFLKIWNKHMHKSIKQYPPHCSCSALTTRDNYLTVRTTNVKLEGDMRKKGEGAEVGTCSPLTSTTVNWSPKSLNTCAYKPFTSAMISWMPSQREDLPKIH